jgi:hypothetical protein
MEPVASHSPFTNLATLMEKSVSLALGPEKDLA